MSRYLDRLAERATGRVGVSSLVPRQRAPDPGFEPEAHAVHGAEPGAPAPALAGGRANAPERVAASALRAPGAAPAPPGPGQSDAGLDGSEPHTFANVRPQAPPSERAPRPSTPASEPPGPTTRGAAEPAPHRPPTIVPADADGDVSPGILNRARARPAAGPEAPRAQARDPRVEPTAPVDGDVMRTARPRAAPVPGLREHADDNMDDMLGVRAGRAVAPPPAAPAGPAPRAPAHLEPPPPRLERTPASQPAPGLSIGRIEVEVVAEPVRPASRARRPRAPRVAPGATAPRRASGPGFGQR